MERVVDSKNKPFKSISPDKKMPKIKHKNLQQCYKTLLIDRVALTASETCLIV